MSAVRGIWKNGQVVLDGAADWPEGRPLVITDDPLAAADDDMEEREKDFPPDSPLAGLRFMTEDEWSDDPEEIRKWIEDLEADEPLPEDPLEEEKSREWEAKMRAYNIEAVRRQFEEGSP